MIPAPQFHGEVKRGRWIFDKRPILDRLLASLEGKRIVVTVKQDRKRRSTRQNAWWWGVCITEIAEHLGYDAHEHEALHYALVQEWGGSHAEEKTGLLMPNKHSSQLATDEFSDLMDWAVRFAAEKWGMFILLPSDVNGPKDKRPIAKKSEAA